MQFFVFPVPLNTGESKIDFISSVVIMLLLLCYQVSSWFVSLSPFRRYFVLMHTSLLESPLR